jgi:hypothetical protein
MKSAEQKHFWPYEQELRIATPARLKISRSIPVK